jgi:hypothetical protein
VRLQALGVIEVSHMTRKAYPVVAKAPGVLPKAAREDYIAQPQPFENLDACS